LRGFGTSARLTHTIDQVPGMDHALTPSQTHTMCWRSKDQSGCTKPDLGCKFLWAAQCKKPRPQ
jgi:hypothetical protein